MPRVVDHDERRRLVADVAARLVAEGGVDAVTVRDIARVAGCSTTIVSHYFTTKRELLIFTYREAAARAHIRLEEALEGDPGDLRGALEALLPLDQERRRDWQVWFAFWGHAVSDAALGNEQRQRVRGTRAVLADVLMHGSPSERRSTEEIDDEARRLLTTIHGIAAQAIFDPDDWPADRQRQILDTQLEETADAFR